MPPKLKKSPTKEPPKKYANRKRKIELDDENSKIGSNIKRLDDRADDDRSNDDKADDETTNEQVLKEKNLFTNSNNQQSDSGPNKLDGKSDDEEIDPKINNSDSDLNSETLGTNLLNNLELNNFCKKLLKKFNKIKKESENFKEEIFSFNNEIKDLRADIQMVNQHVASLEVRLSNQSNDTKQHDLIELYPGSSLYIDRNKLTFSKCESAALFAGNILTGICSVEQVYRRNMFSGEKK